MVLTQVHFLLTYTCNYECDHCFLYCSPRAEGTFTLPQIRTVLKDARKLRTVEWIYFEGGEPFLFYPTMLAGLRMAGEMGFKKGIVTNCYWATSDEDAEEWLKPLVEIGIDDLSLSDDDFHKTDDRKSPAAIARKTAGRLGLQQYTICIEPPDVRSTPGSKGEPVIGGSALFKGRAVDKLTANLPLRRGQMFKSCDHEELLEPSRVHVDAFGNVHICQGISIGNMWEKPLHKIVKKYKSETHPILGPLSHGGPAELAEYHHIESNDSYIDACHFCFSLRRELLDRYPDILTPGQVYGIENNP